MVRSDKPVSLAILAMDGKQISFVSALLARANSTNFSDGLSHCSFMAALIW